MKTSDYIELDYFQIDDRGAGDYTWEQAAQESWCSGNGTKSDPYVIDNIAVNGKNTSSSLHISNSIAYFVIQNSLFFNSSRNTSGFYSGIYFFNVTNGIVLNNTIHSNMYGIRTRDSEKCQFRENIAKENTKDGFYIYRSNKNNFSNNLLQENGERGYYVHTSNNNMISNDTIINNSESPGIEFQTSQGNNVLNSNISENDVGITTFDSEKNHFENNTIRNNDNVGLSLGSLSHNCSIVNNTIVGNGNYGISISISDDAYIYKNNISKNQGYGLYLNRISLTNVSYNQIRENSNDGVYLIGNNNNISYNQIYKNLANGINLFSFLSYETNYNILHNNTIIKNNAGLRVYSNNIEIKFCNITSNYFFNNTGTGLSLYNAGNNTIQSNTFILHNNSIYTNAMSLSSSYENEVLDNEFIDNGIGISLSESNLNRFYNNTIRKSERYGLQLQSNSDLNVIEKNHFIANWDGIYLYNGDNNTITENIISKSDSIGIDIIEASLSNFNLFAWNFFIDNNAQARDMSGTNFWNNSEIGNYWDDYSGSDDSPVDGIGDSPYSNALGVTDYLPIWDDDDPVIFVDLPLNNSRQPFLAPEFSLTVDEIYLDTIWYTLDNGLTNITCNSSSTIDQNEWFSIWNSLSDGQQIELTFYASDTFGHLGTNTTYLIKDAFPILNITSPLNESTTERKLFDFFIEIEDFLINNMWYTIDGGVIEYPFLINETINSDFLTTWDGKADGEMIMIQFFVNDSLGQISSDTLYLIKKTPEMTDGGEIPGFNVLFMFLGIISMIGLIYFHQNKKL
ncbi:MAG: hypothetical protein GF311_23190 [Candidatus Lokiarchaeota archaeon]|nr:hypothetical protein [Candidatus Lokiarchaeota archaeon]